MQGATLIRNFTTMDQLMSLQVASWNIGFTTVIADVSHLSTMVRFMHLQVANPGKGITTDLADICFLPIIDQFTNAQLQRQANKQTAIAKVYSVMLIHQMVEGSQSSFCL